MTGEGLGSLDVGGSTLRRGRTWKSIAGSRIGGHVPGLAARIYCALIALEIALSVDC